MKIQKAHKMMISGWFNENGETGDVIFRNYALALTASTSLIFAVVPKRGITV
jgi:hypothetical protein